ncbi:NAD-dependent protein deacetylase, SIR2 family [Oryzisolibacter propanilivorax]|uniref:NAD-dependent protein deacetylase n=1 Tax=Oryzisolibacter propanilivorax TaxID=1527607 RepID=A0A1G9UWZ3_9BURK|nr:NAD-dependent protein deacetylase [Oryzisolibacter propanilivorax]SDM64369.1 NAD-dependent protein deacetylase, SIR2 family [Oryzisolibacter propanilivorax]
MPVATPASSEKAAAPGQAAAPDGSPALSDPALLPAPLTLLRNAPRWTVLTGAGISTGSGIPDYRDAAGAWKRPAPVMFQDFMAHAATRRRYWARSLIGWPVFARAQPNAAHQALAQLQAAGYVGTLITQNVDGLHQRAGSTGVIDLHGRLDQTVCMGCGRRAPREEFQQALLQANPGWAHWRAPVAPDGDADLQGVDFSAFAVPPCPLCGGIVKPDVVLYGENVPRERVQAALQALEQSDLLLVVGSSLMVYSGLRFVHAARERGLPVAAINLGRTRADELLMLKVTAPCADVLQMLARSLAQPAATATAATR